MKRLQKDLQALIKGLEQLSQKAERIQKDLKGVEEAQARKKPKAKVTKKAVGKEPSAADIVFNIIKKSRSKKGVNSALIQEKTGFNNQKVRDNLSKLKKKGKIKNTEKGFYVKA